MRGAFSFVFMDEHDAVRRPRPAGHPSARPRPAESGWVVASEDAALATVGARVVREVEPGELVAIDEQRPALAPLRRARAQGLRLRVRLPRPPRRHHRRPQRPPGAGRDGATLAAAFPVEADLVIPVPESGTPAAIGYAEASGIPYGQGFVKNSYVGRTFIQPSQTMRQLGIRLKLNRSSP